MPKLKRLMIKLTLIILILTGIHYFFSHIAFNQVMNNFGQSAIPKGSELSLSSYFSFWPGPSVQINELKYSDKDGTRLDAKAINARLDVSTLLKQRRVAITAFNADGVVLQLKAINFDQLLKGIIFRLIRESLGVATVMKSAPIKEFAVHNLTLKRDNDGIDATTHIQLLSYSAKQQKGVSACFEQSSQAQNFYDTYLRQYLIAAKVQDNCVVFVKPRKTLEILKQQGS